MSAIANPSAEKRRAIASPLPGPTPTTAQTGRLLPSAIAEDLLTPSLSWTKTISNRAAGPHPAGSRRPPSPSGRRFFGAVARPLPLGEGWGYVFDDTATT